MNRSRQSGLDGPLPLSLSDMAAWQQLTREIVRPEEWSIIRAMDAAFVGECHKINAEAGKAEDDHVVSERPMSPALFDALF